MRIFLDDERHPPSTGLYKDAMIVRSCEEFQWLITMCRDSNDTISGISFDHDLGNGPSGMDCAKFLIEYDLDYDILDERFTFTVHSMNPVGAGNIRNIMTSYLSKKFG